jgi:hypothetical protein
MPPIQNSKTLFNAIGQIDRSLKEVKEDLGPDFSYGEIKMMVAHLKAGRDR